MKQFRLGVGMAAMLLVAGAVLSVPAFAATLKLAKSSFYIPDTAIDVSDGVIEAAWGDAIIADGEDDTTRVRHCWNPSSKDWSEVVVPEDCATYLYDELGQIDISTAWFGVNETNMLLAFSTATPMFGILNVAEQAYMDIYSVPEIEASGIDKLPNGEEFDHDMVFAFDAEPTADEETYDWYIVANIMYDIPMLQMENTDFLQLYQESGVTNGFQQTEDTLIGSIDTSLSESNGGSGTDVMEIRQNIEYFYEQTGIQVGDTVGFRLETHSEDGDTTDRVLVKFTDELATPKKPHGLRVAKRTATTAVLHWKKPKTSSVDTYNLQYRFKGDADEASWMSYEDLTGLKKKLQGLVADTAWQFRVQACNTTGCSKYSPWKMFKTKAE